MQSGKVREHNLTCGEDRLTRTIVNTASKRPMNRIRCHIPERSETRVETKTSCGRSWEKRDRRFESGTKLLCSKFGAAHVVHTTAWAWLRSGTRFDCTSDKIELGPFWRCKFALAASEWHRHYPDLLALSVNQFTSLKNTCLCMQDRSMNLCHTQAKFCSLSGLRFCFPPYWSMHVSQL
jgi:hypothetical protein